MTDKSIEEFIKEILRFYAEIPDKEVDWLMKKIQLLKIEKNSCFLRQGDTANRFALIRSGLFRVFCTDINGDEKTLSFRSRGQFITGYSPYIENRSIWYSIQALEESEFIQMKFSDYLELSGRHFCWNDLIRNYVTGLFIEKENRERSLLLEDASTRYLQFLKDFPDYEDKISQYHIASYLGITAVSLSRIRSKLKNSGKKISLT